MNSHKQLAEALYQARLTLAAIEDHLNHTEAQARETLACIKLTRRSIDAWRTNVVHEDCNNQANGKGSEGGGESPPPEKRTS